MLSDCQAVMLGRMDESHGYGTKSAKPGLVVGSGGPRSIEYRVPGEWQTLTEEHRGLRLVVDFKHSLKGDVLVEYRVVQYRVAIFG
jgi:hypothetical protein